MISVIPAKTIVTKTKKPSAWFGIDYNMNIYRGCSHGCIYCDSRSDCYHNPDFDQVKVKENALEIIRNDLRRKVKWGVVGTGAMSDPYNPLEKKLQLTRHALELINAFEFGCALTTKSDLVIRDLDLLQEIRTHSPVLVNLTITTADPEVCGKVEPYVSSSAQRFAALKTLSDEGIFCGVLMMPLLPWINDNPENVKSLLDQAKNAGAKFVYPAMGMTLRSGNRDHYYKQLDQHFPSLSEKYSKTYGTSYQCTSGQAKKLWGLFQEQCQSLGLLYNMRDIIHHYRLGYQRQQLSFFDL